MASFNRVILMGNLTRDPEVRYTPGGHAVSEVSLAVNRTWFDKGTNQRKEEVTFVEVTLWGRTAEVAGEYLSKGRPVLIEGHLKLDQWDDKETSQKRSKLRVVCENMTMLGSKQDGPGGGGGSGGSGGSGGGGSGGSRGSSSSQAPPPNSSDGFEHQEQHSEPMGGFDGPPPGGGGGDEVPF